MSMKKFTWFAILLSFTAITACTLPGNSTSTSDNASSKDLSGTQISAQPSPAKPSSSRDNLVTLFFAKKDNLKNQFRGEVFPIARFINGKYVDASVDLTTEVRNQDQGDALVKKYQQKTPLATTKTLMVLNGEGTKAIGTFQVNKLAIGQFACSSYLVGQGQFANQQPSLQQVFAALPTGRSTTHSGFAAGKQFDETWRWTIATSQSPLPSKPQRLSPTEAASYKQALLKAAAPLITQATQGKPVAGPAVVEQLLPLDLNRDGQPEIFGIVRQGRDPKSISQRDAGRPGNSTVYVSLWLSGSRSQPSVLSSEVIPYQMPVSRRPYDVLGAVDLNGDGVEEVLVRHNGYESIRFGIYELKGNQLKSVFEGAEYGC